MADLTRRTMLGATGAIGATIFTTRPRQIAQVGEQHAAEAPAGAGAAVRHQTTQTTYLFFNMEESRFIEAAVARLIPADEEWPGALEACVPNYIDKQLAGAWGAGERLCRSGPWQPGTASQGYQLPYTPAALFRTALGAINKELSRTPFAQAAPTRMLSLQGPVATRRGRIGARFLAATNASTISRPLASGASPSERAMQAR
jgi:gluconate 2-dehydrogenase gamma chain